MRVQVRPKLRVRCGLFRAYTIIQLFCAKCGVAPSAGISSALVVAISMVPTILLHARAKVWRRNEGEE
jgi:hypothetical protein